MKPEQAAAFLQAFAKLVAKEILAEMTAPATHYGTRKGATLPPGKSRAWALREMPTMPGAKKIGRDWVIAVSDFDAWVTKEATERAVTASRPGLRRGQPANDTPPEDVEALVERSLAANGLRRGR